jgi:hypothetical protein
MNTLVMRNDTIYVWIAELTAKPAGNIFQSWIIHFCKVDIFSDHCK